MKKIKTDTILLSDKYLITVIHLWREYDSISVLVAYSELKRRKYNIPDYIDLELAEFLKKNS